MKKLEKKEIKNKQLAILKEVDKMCNKKGYTYFLTGGSLIGAIRHNGYIPWDDDIDIMMFRDEYEMFIKDFNSVEKHLYAYSLNDKGYNHHFSKICDTSTIIRETNIKSNSIDIGVNIDLFPIDKLPEKINTNKIIKKLIFLDKLQYCKSYKFHRLKNKKAMQIIKIIIFKFISICTSKNKLAKMQNNIAQKYKNWSTERYTIITCHMKNGFPYIYRNNTKVEKHKFENYYFNIPSNYDLYLRQQYGDYMKEPSDIEKQITHNIIAYEK